MKYDVWRDVPNDALQLVYLERNQRTALKFLSDVAYYLCLNGAGLVLREEYHDGARPEIIGVLVVGTSPPKHLKRCHLTPLDQRFAFERRNGLHIVNNQAYFDLNERVKVIDSVAGRNIEFFVERSL